MYRSFLGIESVLDLLCVCVCVYGGILLIFRFIGVFWSYLSNREYFGLFRYGGYFGYFRCFRSTDSF